MAAKNPITPKTTRQERGKQLFDEGRVSETEIGWLVQSTSGNSYEVQQTFDANAFLYFCPCKDAERGFTCKHQWATEYLRVSQNMLPWLSSTPAPQVETLVEKLGRVKALLDYALNAETLDEREDYVVFAKQYSEMMLEEVA